MPVNELGGKLKVFRSGRFVQVATSCGVKVNFDGVHAVSVTVPGSYRGKLTGLCGDCNGKRDDMRTRTGRDVSREKLKYSLIGNSYEVAGGKDAKGEKYDFYSLLMFESNHDFFLASRYVFNIQLI